MADGFDPFLDSLTVASLPPPRGPVRGRSGVKRRKLPVTGRFVQSDRIPEWWLIRAAALPHKALAIAFIIWRLRQTTKRNRFPLMNSDLERWHIDRKTKSRGVAALERAKLISVKRKTHRWPLITILDRPDDDAAGLGHEGGIDGRNDAERVEAWCSRATIADHKVP